MAQTYKMKHNLQGTIYSLLTVESDGRMTMTFHGTDREICHEANVTEDGRIATGGSMFPGLESGKWQAVAQMRNDVQGTALRGQAPCNPPSATHTGDSPREPRVRRQRKPRKPRVERQPSDISHQPSDIDLQPSDISHQPSSTMKAIGMVAAATVALFVIYETGLLIPLGLIGLATGGLLK